MPKSRLQKQEILRDLGAKVAQAKSIVFAKFNALTVVENEELRDKLVAENSEYLATKKTLLNIAIKDLNLGDFNAKDFDGQIASIFSYQDEVAAAKIVDNFIKEHKDKVEFVGGILENKFIDAAQVRALAQLPSKHELYGKLVGTLNAPISGFVNVLAGNLRGLVTVLKAVADKK